jgi:hypothetical protein
MIPGIFCPCPFIGRICWMIGCYFLAVISLSGQQVVWVDHAHQADHRVWQARYPQQAELMVYWVNHPHQARGKEGRWYLVAHPHQAEWKLYRVAHPHQADLRIYEVAHPHQAGWRRKVQKD